LSYFKILYLYFVLNYSVTIYFMRNATRILIFSSAVSVMSLGSCRKDVTTVTGKYAFEYSGDFTRYWFNVETKLIKETPGFFPPQAARALGYAGLTLHESVVHGTYAGNGQSLAGQINGLNAADMPKPKENIAYNWAIVANSAMAEILRRLFETKITPDNAKLIDNTERLNLERFRSELNSGDILNSVEFGVSIAKAIYDYSKMDKGHQAYLDPFQLPFAIETGADKWVPTSATTTPLTPKWGSNRPFLTQNLDESLVPAMIPFSLDTTSVFWKEAKAVSNQSKTNTAEQIEIAKFWADDPVKTFTPAGHSFNILTQLLSEGQARLDKCAVAYAKLGLAENDAFIACWRTKFKHNLLRPVTYIKRHIDPDFTTLLGTPPFPAYTSGHASESAAAARIFGSLFGNGGVYPFTDKTQNVLGFNARAFDSFEQMAQECADSRFYGGIHYPQDNKSGLACGKKIADNVNTSIQWTKYIQ
jgi:hypothetical protein